MWIDAIPKQKSKSLLRDLAKSLASSGPVSSYLFGLLKAGDYDSLVDFDFSEVYHGGTSVEDIISARQIQAFYSKNTSTPLKNADPVRTAFDNFKSCEESCLQTNKRIKYCVPEWDVAAIALIAQRKIAEVLPDVPSLDSLELSFGPGANTNVQRREANPRIKLSRSLEIPYHMDVQDAIDIMSCFPGWCASSWNSLEFQRVHGKGSMVHKNARTHRVVLVEPLVASIKQRGIGRVIRKSLKYVGIDLNDQSHNQNAAYEGSLNPDICTVDVKTASDTIAIMAVCDLFNPEWVDLLASCRTSTCELLGTVFDLQKWSSMGNGYTFELESLIFWALTDAIHSHLGLDFKTLVYGDDIICHREAVPLLKKVFAWYGFTVNSAKSYTWDVKFRESCGKDYYDGTDIRPVYLKGPLSYADLFRLHNFFIRTMKFDLAARILKDVPDHLRIYGPDGVGDGHLLGEFGRPMPRAMRRSGFEGVVYDTYVRTVAELPKKFRLRGDYVYPFYNIYVKSLSHERGAKGSNSFHITHDTSEDDLMFAFQNGLTVAECGNPHNVLPVVVGYKMISVYTLRKSIFGY